ncbi:MAG TPA: hypothetical protein VJA94_14455 [Candidatus Angelobacter sp.]
MINIYDAIRERENQTSILQKQISTLQAEIEALRVAIRILEAGSITGSQTIPAGGSQTIPAAVVHAANNPGAEKAGVWP